MSRPIKFRAWDGKKMTINIGVMPVVAFADADRMRVPHSGDYFRPDKWQVMQFTYLLDKNGNSIYEGDILKIWGKTRRNKMEGRLGVVEWYTNHARWGIKLDTGLTAFYPFEKEVVGNIYENPDLIK